MIMSGVLLFYLCVNCRILLGCDSLLWIRIVLVLVFVYVFVWCSVLFIF